MAPTHLTYRAKHSSGRRVLLQHGGRHPLTHIHTRARIMRVCVHVTDCGAINLVVWRWLRHRAAVMANPVSCSGQRPSQAHPSQQETRHWSVSGRPRTLGVWERRNVRPVQPGGWGWGSLCATCELSAHLLSTVNIGPTGLHVAPQCPRPHTKARRTRAQNAVFSVRCVRSMRSRLLTGSAPVQ